MNTPAVSAYVRAFGPVSLRQTAVYSRRARRRRARCQASARGDRRHRWPDTVSRRRPDRPKRGFRSAKRTSLSERRRPAKQRWGVFFRRLRRRDSISEVTGSLPYTLFRCLRTYQRSGTSSFELFLVPPVRNSAKSRSVGVSSSPSRTNSSGPISPLTVPWRRRPLLSSLKRHETALRTAPFAPDEVQPCPIAAGKAQYHRWVRAAGDRRLAFVDADGSTAVNSSNGYWPGHRLPNGPRCGLPPHPDATVATHQTFARRFLGDGFAWIAVQLLDARLYDYQCGAKAIDVAAWARVRPTSTSPASRGISN